MLGEGHVVGAGHVIQSLPRRENRRKQERRGEDEDRGGEAAEATQFEEVKGWEGEATTAPGLQNQQYEYLDHTADVILHAWDETFGGALRHLGLSMFGYMTDIALIEEKEVRRIDAYGRDLKDAVFHFLDELLFLYGSEYFFSSRIEILKIDSTAEHDAAEHGADEEVQGKVDSDSKALRITAKCFGEIFDHSRHSQGTEIKAITMHEMKIVGATTLDNTAPTVAPTSSDASTPSTPLVEIFVLVDI